MSINRVQQRLHAWQDRQQVWWMSIAVFAIVFAYADGLWVTSLQGAVGASERHQPPFQRWLRDSTLMVPVYVLVALAAVLMARRLAGQGHGKVVKFGTTALLIVLLSSAVATAEVAASSAYDYHLQTRHLELQHASHTTLVAAQPGTIVPAGTSTCTGTCAAQQNMFDMHVRAVLYASKVMLITNVVLVLSFVRARFAAVSAAVAALVVGAVVIGLTPFVAHALPGTDVLSPDSGAAEEFGGHLLVLSNGKRSCRDHHLSPSAPMDEQAHQPVQCESDVALQGRSDTHQLGSEPPQKVGDPRSTS